MQIKNLLPFFFIGCLACHSTSEKGSTKAEKFDKIKWAIKQGKRYPYRDNMLTDLITNYELHGVKMDSIISLLGQPNRTDTGYLFYTVAQTFFANTLYPFSTKSLVIKFRADSTVEWRKVHE